MPCLVNVLHEFKDGLIRVERATFKGMLGLQNYLSLHGIYWGISLIKCQHPNCDLLIRL